MNALLLKKRIHDAIEDIEDAEYLESIYTVLAHQCIEQEKEPHLYDLSVAQHSSFWSGSMANTAQQRNWWERLVPAKK